LIGDGRVRCRLRPVLRTVLTGYSVCIHIFLEAGGVCTINVIIFQNSVDSYNVIHWYIYSLHRTGFTVSTIILTLSNINTETLLVFYPSHSFLLHFI
jgi:hypothetical protein